MQKPAKDSTMSNEIRQALKLLCGEGAHGIRFDVNAYMSISADLMDDVERQGPDYSSYDNGHMVIYSDDVHAWCNENEHKLMPEEDGPTSLATLMRNIRDTVPLGFDITLSID